MYVFVLFHFQIFFLVDRYDIQYKEAKSEVWTYYERVEKPFKKCPKQDNSQTQGNLLGDIDNKTIRRC